MHYKIINLPYTLSRGYHIKLDSQLAYKHQDVICPLKDRMGRLRYYYVAGELTLKPGETVQILDDELDRDGIDIRYEILEEDD